MSFEDVLEIVSRVKRELSKRVAGKLLYLSVSGSHLYGFTSKDSDVDYRGCYLVDTNILLGLSRPKDVINLNPDIVLFEIDKELGLALKGNCNVLEHINAKPVYSTPEYLKMKRLVNNAIGKKGLYNSYKGMATFNYKKFILGGKANPKKYLYVFRGLMAGIYVLQTGQIEANLETLNRYFKIPIIKELITAKRNGFEKGEMPKNLDTGVLEERIQELYERIDKAYEKSKMPEKPSYEEIADVNSFLIELRRDFNEAV